MQTIPIPDIIIPDNRQRREFDPDALRELGESIVALGMMQPIVLRNDRTTLVAGERRLRALVNNVYFMGRAFTFQGQVVPVNEVPYVTLGDLDPLALEEAELDENTKRKDLTWQEQAAALARLQELRQAQAAAKGSEHTVADLALETKGRNDGWYQVSTRKSLIVAQHLNDPEVAKAKTVDDAFKVLKKQEESKRNVALSIAVGKTYTAASHEAYNVNCLDWMADPANHGIFDVILTDPPYGMGADTFGDGAGRLAGIEHHYDDSYESWLVLMDRWTALSFAITKPAAHAYVFCDFDNFHELKRMMRKAGWYVFRTPLINVKGNSGRVPLPDRGPRRTYEICLYAIKGDKPVTGIYPDVITSLADEQMSHGAQKPVALYEDLLRRSCRPGDKVLDSFAGSGTIFPACHSLRLYATGLEASQESFGMCLARLNQLETNHE